MIYHGSTGKKVNNHLKLYVNRMFSEWTSYALPYTSILESVFRSFYYTTIIEKSPFNEMNHTYTAVSTKVVQKKRESVRDNAER